MPIQQSEIFIAKAKSLGLEKVKLIVRPGKDHGWPEIGEDIKVFAAWFDEHLRGIKP